MRFRDELIRKIRNDVKTRPVPIVFMTARGSEKDLSECILLGADDCLVKPFSARELITQVHRHVSLAQMRKNASEVRYHEFTIRY